MGEQCAPNLRRGNRGVKPGGLGAQSRHEGVHVTMLCRVLNELEIKDETTTHEKKQRLQRVRPQGWKKRPWGGACRSPETQP